MQRFVATAWAQWKLLLLLAAVFHANKIFIHLFYFFCCAFPYAKKFFLAIEYKYSTIGISTGVLLTAIAAHIPANRAKNRWVKSLKTRAKNIVREGKKLASLRYFVEWLDENKESY